ncbi:unnamed protein product, partial [Ectocarpus sp. 4 AP-2014]
PRLLLLDANLEVELIPRQTSRRGDHRLHRETFFSRTGGSVRRSGRCRWSHRCGRRCRCRGGCILPYGRRRRPRRLLPPPRPPVAARPPNVAETLQPPNNRIANVAAVGIFVATATIATPFCSFVGSLLAWSISTTPSRKSSSGTAPASDPAAPGAAQERPASLARRGRRTPGARLPAVEVVCK